MRNNSKTTNTHKPTNTKNSFFNEKAIKKHNNKKNIYIGERQQHPQHTHEHIFVRKNKANKHNKKKNKKNKHANTPGKQATNTQHKH